MTKNVSKTISIYTYTFKMCNKKTNEVKDVDIDSFAEAKNPKQLRAIFDTSKHAKNNFFVTGEYKGVRFEMYKMAISDFVKSATKVEADQNNNSEEVSKNE